MEPGWPDRQGLASPGPWWACSPVRHPLPRCPHRDVLPRCGPSFPEVRVVLEARDRTKRHLQPAFLLGRGLRSQDHRHQGECLRQRGHGERRQIQDEGPARPSEV